MTDYIIVGSGPAGCVIANRLSADPGTSVLLLEAGGTDWHPLIQIPAGFAKMTKGIASWGWSTVPQTHMQGRVFRYTQAKVIGGGSSINAQIYTRGNRADYDNWATNEGCPGWSYRQVLPYFMRAEDNQSLENEFHATGGPLAISDPAAPLPICEAYFKAAGQLGIPHNQDFNGTEQEGVGYYQLTQKNAKRASASVAYLKPIRSRPNLTIRSGVQVTRIIVEKGRATGVEIADRNGLKILSAGAEIVVTSGAIGSPKLLLQSGIGPPDHLNSVGVPVVHELAGVGANLHDHLDLFTIAECTGDHTYDGYASPIRTVLAGIEYVVFKSGPAASSLFETGGFWRVGEGAKTPDVQLHLGLGSGIEAGVEKLKNAGVTLNSAYLRPRSRGTVRLASADPNAAPLIDPNYWSDPNDREMSLKGLRLVREIMAQPALEKYVLREVMPGPGETSDQALIEYACRTAKTDHHPVGTCRMGGGEMAVVDPELRVRGIDGLRVCDSSIMPSIPSCNTNGPTIMVGEKGADMILGKTPLAPAVFRANLGEGPT